MCHCIIPKRCLPNSHLCIGGGGGDPLAPECLEFFHSTALLHCSLYKVDAFDRYGLCCKVGT